MVEQRSKVRRYSGFVMGRPASIRAMGGEEGVEARREARRQPAVPPISSEYFDHLKYIYIYVLGARLTSNNDKVIFLRHSHFQYLSQPILKTQTDDRPHPTYITPSLCTL